MIRPSRDLTILGAGPAGLATAFYAHREGIPFLLLEQSSSVGGLCRTLRCGGHAYDTGAHRFHDRYPEVSRDLRDLLGESLRPVDAPSHVYLSGRFIDFPPTPLNALRSSGLVEAGRAGFEMIRCRLQKRPEVSFADYAVNTFGKTLARKFVLNYSEKLWGLPAEKLSPDIATRRLSGMTFGSLVRELFWRSRKTAHIDGSFLYPRFGYGQICTALEERLPPGTIRRRHRVSGLKCLNGSIRWVEFEDRRPLPVPDRVVSTLPLTALVGLLGNRLPPAVHEAAGALRFRNLRLLFLRLAQAKVSRRATIYFPDKSMCTSRIHEPRNRSAEMAPEGETSLVAEVPCFPEDAVAGLSPEQLMQRVVGELEAAGLTQRQRVIDWRHHLLAHAYPVYSLDYAQRVHTIRCAAKGILNLQLLGRGGTFFYSHLHHQMRLARDFIVQLADE